MNGDAGNTSEELSDEKSDAGSDYERKSVGQHHRGTRHTGNGYDNAEVDDGGDVEYDNDWGFGDDVRDSDDAEEAEHVGSREECEEEDCGCEEEDFGGDEEIEEDVAGEQRRLRKSDVEYEPDDSAHNNNENDDERVDGYDADGGDDAERRPDEGSDDGGDDEKVRPSIRTIWTVTMWTT